MVVTQRAEKVRPNIVVALIDTLRADHVSCYGYERPTTPRIDGIAGHGVVYENAISPAAWTPPAHASLFTGTYPSRHGVTRSRLVLDPALSPLPEVLRRHGYRTYGVSSNYWLSRETQFDRGFDEFIHCWQLVQTGGNVPLERQQHKQDLGLERLNGKGRRGLADAYGNAVNALYDRATQKWLRSFHAYDDGAWRVNRLVQRWARDWQRADTPFFAFLHYMEPHIRYRAPGRYRTLHTPRGVSARRLRRVNQNPWRYVVGAKAMDEEDFAILCGLYDGEVSYVDQRIGQIYDLLHDRGLLRNTVLIITSDHGENLGDHQLMDHQYCLYDTLLRVPLIVCFPPEFPRGTRIAEQVQTLDLFPTLLQLAGIRDDDAWGQVQGQSLFPADVTGQTERSLVAEYLEPQPPVSVLRAKYPTVDVARFDRTLRAIRTEHYKYIWASDGKNELYDLHADPHEGRNLIAEQAERAATLHASLEQTVDSFGCAPTGSQSVEFDAVTLERLRQLGYLA
jgi:arylsulfatase A-like enzyme